MADQQKGGADFLFKSAIKVIESMSKLEQEKSKIKTELLKENIKRKENFATKIA